MIWIAQLNIDFKLKKYSGAKFFALFSSIIYIPYR